MQQGSAPPPPPPAPGRGRPSQQLDISALEEENRHLREENERLRNEIESCKNEGGSSIGQAAPSIPPHHQKLLGLKLGNVLRGPMERTWGLLASKEGLLYVCGKDKGDYGIKGYNQNLGMSGNMITCVPDPEKMADNSKFLLVLGLSMNVNLLIINKAQGTVGRTLEFPRDEIAELVANETHCAINAGGTLRILELRLMKEVAKLSAKLFVVGGIAFYKNLVIYGDSYTCIVYDLTTKQEVTTFKTIYVQSLLVHEDKLIVGGSSGPIAIVDLNTFQEIAIMKGHRDSVLRMAIEGSTLYSVDKYSVKVWDLETYALVNSVSCPSEYKSFVDMALWNGKLATLTADKVDILVWEFP